MAHESEPHQADLLIDDLLEPPFPAEKPLLADDLEEENSPSVFPEKTNEIVAVEANAPRATRREVRAVRSLLYNRWLLKAVVRRIDTAEAIIHGFLLTQDSTSVRMGPYQVKLDEAEEIYATKVEEDDGWQQLEISKTAENPVPEEMGSDQEPLTESPQRGLQPEGPRVRPVQLRCPGRSRYVDPG